MANTTITTGKQTAGQFTINYQRNGYGAIIPEIDGVKHPELMMGYVSEADAAAGMELLRQALVATQGNIPAAMQYMYTAATVTANEIKADEAVEVDGEEYIISYETRKAYLEGEEVANLDDLTCALPNEAVKALLVERVGN